MSESFIPLIVFIFALALGYFVGRYISTLKHKEKAAFSVEQNNQLKLHIEDLRSRLTRSLEENKQQLNQIKTEAEERLKSIKMEREEIRREKDLYSIELTRRNAEFENLQQKNHEQKQEVEKLQEKFTKEFENLANRILEQKSEKFTLLNKENLQN